MLRSERAVVRCLGRVFFTFSQPFRCGMAFPPHPCYGLPGRHCLSGHLPQRQQFLHFSAVAEWLFRRILAMGFLDGIVSPVPFHNGSNFRISLPLRNGFSAASLLWASWTALSPQSPSTTAAIPAFLCRCGTSFPPHPCMGFLDGIVSPVPFHNGSNSCISLPLWNFFSAASLLWASWTALSLRAPSTTALITAFSCRCGKDRRAHLPKVIRILPDLAHLRKVERGGWKRKRGHRRYRGPREIAHFRKVRQKRENSAHLRKVSRNAEKHDSFRRSEEVSGKLWNEGDAKGWTGPKREGGGVCRKPMPGLREPPVKRISL